MCQAMVEWFSLGCQVHDNIMGVGPGEDPGTQHSEDDSLVAMVNTDDKVRTVILQSSVSIWTYVVFHQFRDRNIWNIILT